METRFEQRILRNGPLLFTHILTIDGACQALFTTAELQRSISRISGGAPYSEFPSKIHISKTTADGAMKFLQLMRTYTGHLRLQ
jgi:hypothetical protein